MALLPPTTPAAPAASLLAHHDPELTSHHIHMPFTASWPPKPLCRYLGTRGWPYLPRSTRHPYSDTSHFSPKRQTPRSIRLPGHRTFGRRRPLQFPGRMEPALLSDKNVTRLQNGTEPY